jgi:hypothetical protein
MASSGHNGSTGVAITFAHGDPQDRVASCSSTGDAGRGRTSPVGLIPTVNYIGTSHIVDHEINIQRRIGNKASALPMTVQRRDSGGSRLKRGSSEPREVFRGTNERRKSPGKIAALHSSLMRASERLPRLIRASKMTGKTCRGSFDARLRVGKVSRPYSTLGRGREVLPNHGRLSFEAGKSFPGILERHEELGNISQGWMTLQWIWLKWIREAGRRGVSMLGGRMIDWPRMTRMDADCGQNEQNGQNEEGTAARPQSWINMGAGAAVAAPLCGAWRGGPGHRNGAQAGSPCHLEEC